MVRITFDWPLIIGAWALIITMTVGSALWEVWPQTLDQLGFALERGLMHGVGLSAGLTGGYGLLGLATALWLMVEPSLDRLTDRMHWRNRLPVPQGQRARARIPWLKTLLTFLCAPAVIVTVICIWRTIVESWLAGSLSLLWPSLELYFWSAVLVWLMMFTALADALWKGWRERRRAGRNRRG